jgi:CelD/BcsL family acetyltransferase involved in cellulose biosynthesis
VFLLPGWLRAWHETLGRGAELVVPQIRRRGRLIGAAVFAEAGGVLEFAGRGPSDYCDVVVAGDLEVAERRRLTTSLISAAVGAVRGFKWSRLSNVRVDSLTPEVVLGPGSGVFATEERRIPAPAMDMAVVEERLAKKSLRRHEKGLAKRGALVVETHRRAERILPELDDFFDQHVRRWRGTEWPSQFRSPSQRDFYRRFTERLDETGVLRFTTVKLDGRLIAAHYGFLHAGRFVWYKPTYEPELAKLSPGEVLLKRLFELARDEQAHEFDFTIGDEAFKLRFATLTRQVVDLHLTRSPLRAIVRRARAVARRLRGLVP